MATISTEMSQQTTANVYNDKGSERVLAVSATCSIRPGRGLNISIDISDSGALEGVKEEAAAGLAVRAALRHEQKDVTTLIISHRVTTLSQADLILVLENGQITQQGTHAELCSQPGLYQRINSIQNALEEELTQAKAAEGVN